MKKLICTILTLCTLLCSLPLAAFADNGVKASIEKCTYTDGNINIELKIESSTKDCKAVFALYNAEKMLTKAIAKPIKAGEKNLALQIPCKKADVKNVAVHFIYGITNPDTKAGSSLSATVSDPSEPIVAPEKEPAAPETNDKTESGGSYAIFITDVGTKITDNGEAVVVTGYANGREKEYVSEKADVSNVETGKIGVPVTTLNRVLKYFIMVGPGRTVISDTRETLGGVLTDIDNKRDYVTISGEKFKIKPSTNVYVYDEGARTRVKYRVNEYMDYLDYDEELGIYIDDDRHHLNVSAYVCLEDGEVVDLLYYINE